MIKKDFSYGKQTIDNEDINAVIEALKSDWLTQGPKIAEFENSLSEKFNANHVTAVINGTAALHLIGLALGWQENDIIITSPITFLASANCILYANATPDFVDIDEKSYTIDLNKLEKKINYYRNNGKQVRAVIAVDFAGHPSDWRSLRNLANKYEFQLINDNCHALGAEYYGDAKYAVKYADVVSMSFHPVKHITTGEGGAILTNNLKLDDKVKNLRTHGITKDEKFLTRNDGPWYYEMKNLGFNYRITDFQCALGSSQLNKLDKFVSKRNEIASFYDEQFKNNEKFIVPATKENIKHAYHLYPLQIKFNELTISKKDFFERMKENKIHLQVHYIPIHLQPYYKLKFGFQKDDFPVSEEFYKNEVSIPVYPLLETEDLEYIVSKIKEFAA